MTNKKRFSKHFNPDTAFFDLPLIRLTLLVGFSVVMGIVIAISVVDWREPDWSAAGFNELITMFKLPIGLLAFFAAVLALFATNHRSEQNKQAMALTQRSINATGDQNRFANYYKHLEEFAKYCRSVEAEYADNAVKIKDRDLHNLLFPNMRNGNSDIPNPVGLHFIEMFSQIAHTANNLSGIKNNDANSDLNLTVILVDLGMKIQYLNNYLVVEPSKNEVDSILEVIDEQYREVVRQLITLHRIFFALRKTIKFDPDFHIANLYTIEELGAALGQLRFQLVKNNV